MFNDPDGANKRFPVPVLQCLQIKQMTAKTGDAPSDRWRLVISDGDNYCQAMLATQANHVISDDKLQRGMMCRIRGYQANIVKDKKSVVCLGLVLVTLANSR
jgi:replication factor A1